MSTVRYRPDYAKFVFTVQRGTWHQYSERFHEASHQRKYSTEWLKSHKMNCWYSNQGIDTETWSVDIWGEWAGVVELLPVSFFPCLRRFDVRATIWDCDEATVVRIGSYLAEHVTSHNVTTYSTKPASKRLGRDRGGKGFGIGSHKSDLRVTVYKRSGEPAAQEYQCSGTMLHNIIAKLIEGGCLDNQTISPWAALSRDVQARGAARIDSVFNSAGLARYWPVLAAEPLPALPPIQSVFLPELGEADDGEGSQEQGDGLHGLG